MYTGGGGYPLPRSEDVAVFSEQKIVENPIFSWFFSGDLIGRPYIARPYVVVWVAKWCYFLAVGRVFLSIQITRIEYRTSRTVFVIRDVSVSV